MRPIEPMQLAVGRRPNHAARVNDVHPGDRLRPPRPWSRQRQRRRTRRGRQRRSAPALTRHLQAGTARRALVRNLAHLQQCLADPRLPDHQRGILHQSMAALEGSLQEHRALSTNMAAMLLG